VVTAQRREESINKVPISVTALSQRTMDDLSIVSLTDLATVVPGLSFSPPSNYQDNAEIVLRGVVSQGNSPTTQIYIDETPIAIREIPGTFSRSPFPNIFDLDRVEVLRGPQGTIFGASAMAGAIRYITPQPSVRESSGSVKADVGYTEGGGANYEVGAAYGAPISTGLAGFRVSAWFQSLSGFIDREDPFTGQILQTNANYSNAYAIRPAVTFTPSENLTITPAAFFQHQHNNAPNSYWVSSSLTGFLPEDRRVWGGINQPLTDNLTVASLAIKYTFSGLAFTSDTSYLDRNSDVREDVVHLFEYIFSAGPYSPGPTPFIPGLDYSYTGYEQNMSDTLAWQQEFRLASNEPGSRVNWIVGAYYRNAKQFLGQAQHQDLSPITQYCCHQTAEQFFGNPETTYNGQTVSQYGYATVRDISEALFADVAWNLTSSLKLDVGARYEHVVVKDQYQYGIGNFGPVNLTIPDAVANPVTPRASLSYQFTDIDMVYISAAKGYRPGGGNNVSVNTIPECVKDLNLYGLNAVPDSFAPDSLWSYELGTKSQLFDRRVSIAASVYYSKWDNIQTVLPLPDCANQFVSNVGRATIEGFELELHAIPVEGLKLGTQVAYTNAYYPDSTYAKAINAPPTLIIPAGGKIPFVLPWTAAATAEYSRQIDSLWSGARSYVRLDCRWQGKMNPTPSGNDPNVANYDPETSPYPNPAYGVLNARVGVTHNGWDFSAYVSNATGADPLLGYRHDVVGEPLFYATAIRPRTYGLTGWYRF
jgi:outer membrane receptor protein involved in Fe transport